MPKYDTMPINYAGCDEVIALHLRRNESIMCDCWNAGSFSRRKGYVIGFVSATSKYKAIETSTNKEMEFTFASPTIKVVRKVKTVLELVEILINEGYEPHKSGIWCKCMHNCIFSYFNPLMFFYCGKEIGIGEEEYGWQDKWLVPVE